MFVYLTGVSALRGHPSHIGFFIKLLLQLGNDYEFTHVRNAKKEGSP